MRRAVSVGLLLAILLGMLLYAYAKPERVARIGDIAPEIKTQDIRGTAFDLRTLRGRPVLLNFFATWCVPCSDEAPALSAFAEKWQGKVDVVLVDRGDPPAMVTNFVTRLRIPDAVHVLQNNPDTWSAPFGVSGQPESFVLDSSGRIVRHIVGPLTEADLEAAFENVH